MFPCPKKQNVFNGTRVTHVHQLRPQRFVSTSPEKDVCTQDLRLEIKTLVCWIPAGDPLPVKAKERLVIQGQHCPDNAQGLVRTDAPTVHRTAVSVFLQIVSSMGWCRSLRGVDVSCASCEKNLEKPRTRCSLSGLHVASLDSRNEP